MSAGLKPYQWRSQDINNGTPFTANFIFGEGISFDTFSAQTIETERPDNHPLFVRTQPDGIRFGMEVRCNDLSQANIDNLKKIFSPEEGEGYLSADDNMGDAPSERRQILCVVEKLLATSPNVYTVAFRSSTGKWEAIDDEDDVVTTISTSGQTFVINNNGTARVRPTFVIKPKVLVSNINSWAKRRHIVWVNRSESPLYDSVGRGYPILLCDLSALTPAITPSAAVRVVLNGEEIPRYLSGNKLWCNLQARPRKQLTLSENISDSFTGTITPSDPEGVAHWPESGFLLIDDEAIQYENRTNTTIDILARAQLGTTAAAHTTSTKGYWIEHTNMYLLYDYSVAADPPEPVDEQPLIDLANSTNSHWQWLSTYFNANDRRSAAWRRDFVEDNAASEYIRLYESGGKLTFENAPAVTGRPLANRAIMEVPCALSLSVIGVSHDTDHVGQVPLEGYSYRKKVVRTSYSYTKYNTGERYTYQSGPNSETLAFRYELRQTNAVETILEDTFPSAQGAESERTNYSAIPTGNQLPPVTFGNITTYGTDEKQVVPTSTISTTYTQEKGVISQESIESQYFGIDIDGNEVSNVVGVIASIPIFRVSYAAIIPIGRDLENEEFTTVHADIIEGTSALFRAYNIEFEFDQNRTPKIVIGPEQDLYLLNGRLQNDTTGDYIDMALSMLIDESLIIDCDAHTVTEFVRNVEVPFVLAASNPKEWLYHKPGANTYSFTMVGIGAGAGNVEITETHRKKWL